MSERAAAIDPKWYRQVLGQYPTGVCLIAATQTDGMPIGMVVGSFTSVSLDPPLVAFFPDRGSGSWAKLSECRNFCVNILAAEQEMTCRKLASRESDKFAEIGYELSPLGSPIIDGAVAWIDCELHRIDEAGDHFVVLGLVRDMAIANGGLPLLFFQGGYGKFAPSSLMASDTHGLLAEQLRIVDCARAEMERIASDLSAQCIASTRVGNELIFAASAGQSESGAPTFPVGQRVPFAPPLGSIFAAWLPADQSDQWIGTGTNEAQRQAYRKALAVVRARGFAVGLPRHKGHRAFTDRLKGQVESSELQRGDFEELIAGLQFDPAEMAAQPGEDALMISAPIFDPAGNVVVSLTVQGFTPPTSPAKAHENVTRVVEGAKRITAALGGHEPRRQGS
jgi:flavin reductase (DIM6/NTAB) family NADH-FMN oxidoreductase RutF/DNA-binding IclR family transcriptional regulator